MTMTTFPTEYPATTIHRGARTGAPYAIGHAEGGCSMVSDSDLDGNADEMAQRDPAWPCSTCFPTTGTYRRLVGSEPVVTLPSGGGRSARVAAAEADPQVAEAVAYAKAYSGTFDFMVAMREKAQKASWVPTPNMVVAILKCKSRDGDRLAKPVSGSPAPSADVRQPSPKQTDFLRSLLAERTGPDVEAIRGRLNLHREAGTLSFEVVSLAITDLLELPRNAGEASQSPAKPLPDVPAGKYAVDTDPGAENPVAFYEVDRPEDGKWAGRTFLSRLQGAPGGWNQIPVRGEAARTILAKIVEDGPQEAAARFGHLTKTCGRCDAPLSNVQSRAAGYGETCAGKVGWRYPSKAEAEAILAARGES